MKHTQKNYLRTLRLKSGLTQKDVAYLLGLKSHEKISSIETRKKLPTIDVVIACCKVYAVKPNDFIRDDVTKIEQNVVHRAKSLYQLLKKQTRNPEIRRRLKALSRIIDAK